MDRFRVFAGPSEDGSNISQESFEVNAANYLDAAFEAGRRCERIGFRVVLIRNLTTGTNEYELTGDGSS